MTETLSTNAPEVSSEKLPPEVKKEPKAGALHALKDKWAAKKKALFKPIFGEEITADDLVVDEQDILERRHRLISLVRWQAVAIGVLSLVLLVAIPALRPVIRYRAVTPEGKKMFLAPLTVPNLTNQSVLSWAASSVTEIMTFGFGDIDRQITSQRHRFTTRGWESFLEAIRRQEVWKVFKERQLILTTVPSDAPVLTGQGLGVDGDYIWMIQIPVVMNYITNNDVTRKQKGTVKLTITRVPGSKNINGIAIKSWDIR